MPVGFGDERYFFTFIDDHIRIIETYIVKRKSEWFKCLKTFHNLAQTRTKLDQLTERSRSDYGFKLQSQKNDKWLINQGIVFEPLASYSQKENRVSEKTSQTIMEMMRAKILEGEIENILWPEVVLTMTHIKNV